MPVFSTRLALNLRSCFSCDKLLWRLTLPGCCVSGLSKIKVHPYLLVSAEGLWHWSFCKMIIVDTSMRYFWGPPSPGGTRGKGCWGPLNSGGCAWKEVPGTPEPWGCARKGVPGTPEPWGVRGMGCWVWTHRKVGVRTHHPGQSTDTPFYFQ